MHRTASLSLTASLLCVAPIASAELAEVELRAVQCAATAVVTHGVVSSMDELGVPVPAGALAFAERASDALYTAALPLIDAGSEGAEEMAEMVQTLLAARDAALTDGTFTQWFPAMVDTVADCYAVFVERREQVE